MSRKNSLRYSGCKCGNDRDVCVDCMKEFIESAEKRMGELEGEIQQLELSMSSKKASGDMFIEIYQIVCKLESYLGRGKKVDSIELQREIGIRNDTSSIIGMRICHTDYTQRSPPYPIDCSRFCPYETYRKNEWVITCPNKLRRNALLDRIKD